MLMRSVYLLTDSVQELPPLGKRSAYIHEDACVPYGSTPKAHSPANHVADGV